MSARRRRDKARPGERIVAAGQWIGRHVNHSLGEFVYARGVARHGRALDRELDRRAAAETTPEGARLMRSNARLSLLLLSCAVLVGFTRQLAGPVFELVGETATDTLSTIGTTLSVGAVAFAVAAFRDVDHPGRPAPRWRRGPE